MGSFTVTEVGTNVAVSIVSHGQRRLVEPLLGDLARCPSVGEIIVTRNLSEPEFACPPELAGRFRYIDNAKPQGFGANHNQAFATVNTPYFCVLNPDVRLPVDPFPPLLRALQDAKVMVVAPCVRDATGHREDSVRDFPRALDLIARKLGRRKPPSAVARGVELHPDWVAGMFMLFRSADYRSLGGFDERFFLYCEDTDLCARTHAAGGAVVVRTDVEIVHEAQRSSHRKLKYAWWHIRSVAKLLWKHRRGWIRTAQSGSRVVSRQRAA